MRAARISFVVRLAALAASIASPGALGRLGSLGAQLPADTAASSREPVILLGSVSEEWLRQAQATGRASAAGFTLRSASSLAAPLRAPAEHRGRRPAAALVLPRLGWVHNSALPDSRNDGALWAGRGASGSVTGGVRAEWGPVRLLLLPELTWSENRAYPAPDSLLFPPYHELANPTLFPPIPGRSPFSSPFHGPPQSIDLPIRFGDRRVQEWRWGQSTLMAGAGPVSVGVSTENQWWGPGSQNALLLSNNAAGFGHAFLRTSRPIVTRVGSFDARWIVGRLEESRFFNSDPSDDHRSISLIGATWQPKWEPDLTLGAARAVWSPIERDGSWSRVLGNAFSALADVGQPNAAPLADRTLRPGRDQILSLWARWLFPSDGLDVYAEWGRSEFPLSLRDFLQHPGHTQGYTLGLRWLGQPVRRGGAPTVEAEATYVEQSASFRFRPIGSWYTSRAVEQGYTHEGQVLGASIGPGSSSQWISAGWVAPAWRVDGSIMRLRAMEDVPSQRIFQGIDPQQNWCRHDVSLLPGARASLRSRWGSVAAAYTSGWRINTFFENRSRFCPEYLGRDVRNRSLRISVEPAWDGLSF